MAHLQSFHCLGMTRPRIKRPKPTFLSLIESQHHPFLPLPSHHTTHPQLYYSTLFFLLHEGKRRRRRRRSRGRGEMGRGKIVIKKIENPTNRQVTYSKRRTGIMKKAKELTVLCDAQVSIIMFSSTGKLSEYCSPSTETKAIFDRYQQITGINLWSAQYEKMQNYLNHLKDINRNLRKEIRQRMGEGLDGMGIKELRGLEQNLDEALKVVRERKYHLIGTQTDTYKKKLKSAQEAHRNLLQDLEIEGDQAAYGYVVDDAGSQDGPVVLADGGSHIYAIQVQPNQPNLQGIAYGFYDLRLA